MRLLYAEQLAMEKGKKEARVQIARNFLKMGVDASQIAQATGLPESEVKSLQAGDSSATL